SCSLCCKAVTRRCPSGSSLEKRVSTPIRCVWSACCPRAASGHAAATPPSSVMNARRLMLDIELPPALAPASSGFVLAAAAEPPFASGIPRLRAPRENLKLGHEGLTGLVGSPMRYIRVVVGTADHRGGGPPGQKDGRARRSRGAIEQILKV